MPEHKLVINVKILKTVVHITDETIRGGAGDRKISTFTAYINFYYVFMDEKYDNIIIEKWNALTTAEKKTFDYIYRLYDSNHDNIGKAWEEMKNFEGFVKFIQEANLDGKTNSAIMTEWKRDQKFWQQHATRKLTRGSYTKKVRY